MVCVCTSGILLDAEPKSSQPQVFGYPVENPVMPPMAPLTQADSMCQCKLLVIGSARLRYLQIAGKPLEPSDTKANRKRHAGGQVKPGMVTIHMDWAIRNQAPKTRLDYGYGEGSETRWRLVRGVWSTPVMAQDIVRPQGNSGSAVGIQQLKGVILNTVV